MASPRASDRLGLAGPAQQLELVRLTHAITPRGQVALLEAELARAEKRIALLERLLDENGIAFPWGSA